MLYAHIMLSECSTSTILDIFYEIRFNLYNNVSPTNLLNAQHMPLIAIIAFKIYIFNIDLNDLKDAQNHFTGHIKQANVDLFCNPNDQVHLHIMKIEVLHN